MIKDTKQANQVLTKIQQEGLSPQNLYLMKDLSKFLLEKLPKDQQDDSNDNLGTCFRTFLQLSNKAFEIAEKKEVITIDDSSEDENEYHTYSVKSALKKYSGVLSKYFANCVTVISISSDTDTGYNRETVDASIEIKFGNKEKSLTIDFSANMCYDPGEEGSEGEFSIHATISPGSISLHLCSNEDEVDYCSGYGGGIIHMDEVAKLKKHFGMSNDELISTWDMIITALKTLSSSMEHVDCMLENVDKLDISSLSREVLRGGTGKQLTKSSGTRKVPY